MTYLMELSVKSFPCSETCYKNFLALLVRTNECSHALFQTIGCDNMNLLLYNSCSV